MVGKVAAKPPRGDRRDRAKQEADRQLHLRGAEMLDGPNPEEREGSRACEAPRERRKQQRPDRRVEVGAPDQAREPVQELRAVLAERRRRHTDRAGK
jgi:hypothetical protein